MADWMLRLGEVNLIYKYGKSVKILMLTTFSRPVLMVGGGG